MSVREGMGKWKELQKGLKRQRYDEYGHMSFIELGGNH